jgi:quinol monooxygenase YgiN
VYHCRAADFAFLERTTNHGRIGESKLMYTRLFYGTIQPGKADEAWQVLSEFVPRVRQQKGCVFNQVLQSGNEIVGITNWETQADLSAYADSELSRELFRRITPLFMGVPTVRSYEVKLNL